MLSDMELLDCHVQVLYKHNEFNQITHINELPYDNAPSIYIGTSKYGKIVRYSNDLDGNLVNDLDQAIQLSSNIEIAEIFNILNKYKQLSSVWIGPAYVFPKLRKQSLTDVVKITDSNKELLKAKFPYTYEEFEYKQPCYAIIQDDMAVSICCSARQTSMAAEASLYTLEEFRGKGYGLDVSNAWAMDIQSQGRIALYSTSWDNFSSQSVAKKLNLIQYGTDINFS
ncbi:GNAT family N-acetyltransferase [Gottfriedia sp. OAE603]|uniref:GNAT family N-acetyltransferase n=1 Tax=Gottfriedia sp. OAE603 TaxID=2663872 RepID=UPI00178B3CA0